MGYLVGLVLGMGGSWVAQPASFLSLIIITQAILPNAVGSKELGQFSVSHTLGCGSPALQGQVYCFAQTRCRARSSKHCTWWGQCIYCVVFQDFSLTLHPVFSLLPWNAFLWVTLGPLFSNHSADISSFVIDSAFHLPIVLRSRKNKDLSLFLNVLF